MTTPHRPSQAIPARPSQAIPAVPLEDLPFAPGPIEELLRLLMKAARANTLYLPNNPVRIGAVGALRSAFEPVWRETDEVALTFSETEVRWCGHPVMTEASKSGDSLPWTFFKDGIREVRLMQGFQEKEIERLLDILQRVRKASPEEDDLLTMLWEADFTNLRYRYVDLGGEPVAPIDGTPPDIENASPDEVRAAVRAQSDQPAAIVSMQDFDATLYFLDDKELDYLRREIEREYASELRQNVLAMLLDIFEAQPAPAIRAEISELVESMMLLLLASGELYTVAYLLLEVQVAAARATSITPEQRARLGQLPDRLSAREPLGQLLQALDESADLPAQAALSELMAQLRPTALETIFAWLPKLRNPEVRTLVESAAERLALVNTPELVRLVQSKDAPVSLEAMRRAAAMKTTSAVPALGRVLTDGATAHRQAAVQALTAIGSTGALQALERAIDDVDRDIRVSAVKTLANKTHRGVFPRIEQAVKGKKLREADLTEKMAFFEAYGAMCGEGGIAYLDGLLNGKGMFGYKEDPEVRACAAIALGRLGGKKARESLQRSGAEKDIVVRNAVTRALRGGGE